MSASDPIAPARLEALLRGEAGADGSERRIGALLDELTLGEISPPAELRERVRALRAARPVAITPPRRRRHLRSLALAVGGLAAALAVAVVVFSHTSGPARSTQELAPVIDSNQRATPKVSDHGAAQKSATFGAATTAAAAAAPSPLGASVPLPDGQRAQDYAATLRLAVGSVAALSRSTQSVLDTVHALGGAVETVDYGTPSAGSGSALIDLRVPVGRAQEALTSFSSLGTITAQQVQIRDLQSGLDSETNRARALRHRIALLKAKLLSPTLSAVERATLENDLADAQTALSSVLRGVHATQQRAAFARFSLDLVTGRGTAIAPPPRPGAFQRTADDALGVIAVAGRGALFAAIVGGPFVLLAAGAWWLARRLRRRASRRLLESS